MEAEYILAIGFAVFVFLILAGLLVKGLFMSWRDWRKGKDKS